MVIWHWKDKRLQPMQQVQENQDKNFSYLAMYRPSEQKFVRLADEDVRAVAATADYKFAVGTDIRNYELTSSLDGLRYEDVYAVNLQTGERKLAIKHARDVFGTSPDGTHVLYYDDGAFFTFDLASGQSYNITQADSGGVYRYRRRSQRSEACRGGRWGGRRIRARCCFRTAGIFGKRRFTAARA